MDTLSLVNNSRYLTYFKTARIKYYEELKIINYFSLNNISAVISKTECSYFIPLT